jgi:hypothetical protein
VFGSRFFAGGKGAYWIADEPGIFKFTLNITQSVKSGDTEVLPEGRVFFNARIRPVRTRPAVLLVLTFSCCWSYPLCPPPQPWMDCVVCSAVVTVKPRISQDMGEVPGCSLVDGVATVKQDVRASFMGQDYSGILAEYIVVGNFTAAVHRE